MAHAKPLAWSRCCRRKRIRARFKILDSFKPTNPGTPHGLINPLRTA